LHARDALLPDRRAFHSSALGPQHGRLCHVGGALQGCGCDHAPPPHRIGGGALRGHKPAGAPRAPRARCCRTETGAVHGVLRRVWRSPRTCIAVSECPISPRVAWDVCSSTVPATGRACAFVICRSSPKPSATPPPPTTI